MRQWPSRAWDCPMHSNRWSWSNYARGGFNECWKVIRPPCLVSFSTSRIEHSARHRYASSLMFSDSLLALDISTGAIVWQNQFTAGDVYTTPAEGPGPDYDIGATPVLFRGANRDLVGV